MSLKKKKKKTDMPLFLLVFCVCFFIFGQPLWQIVIQKELHLLLKNLVFPNL